MSTPPLMIEINGNRVKLRDACDERGLAFTTVWGRIKKGWSVDEALNKPSHRAPGRKSTHAGGYTKITGTEASEHVLIAEAALGRKLPAGAEVHHVNGKKDDNRKSNLVICPSREYHMILHRRQSAMDQCGNPDFRKCELCGKWDSTEGMYIRKDKSGQWHKTCDSKARAERKRAAKRRSQ